MLNLFQLEGLAHEVGEAVRVGHRALHDPQLIVINATKADDTPVTDVDQYINKLLAERTHYLGVGFVGEEGNGGLDKPYVLLADPIDGTTAFLRGMNTATVILTLMEMQHDGWGQPVRAVIHEPLTERTWSAERHTRGVRFQHGRPSQQWRLLPRNLSQSDADQINSNIVVWPGAGYNLAQVQAAMLADRRIRDQQMGAVGISAGLIASGLLDLCLFGPSSAVEAAAMSLIVEQAGGIARDLDGAPFSRGLEFGEWKGKPDFLLPHGALFASSVEAAATAQRYLREYNGA